MTKIPTDPPPLSKLPDRGKEVTERMIGTWVAGVKVWGMSNYFTPSQTTLMLSPEHIGWDGLCGLIKNNWPQHAGLIDDAMDAVDVAYTTAGSDPEIMAGLPAYYAEASRALRALLTDALSRR